MTPGRLFTLAIWVTVRQSVSINVALPIRNHTHVLTQSHMYPFQPLRDLSALS